MLVQEKIGARFVDEAGEWFDVTLALSKTIVGAPAINQPGEVIGVVTFRAGSNSCVIRPSAAAATLLSQVSSNTTASWRNLTAAATTSATPTPPKIPMQGSKLVYAPHHVIHWMLGNHSLPAKHRAASVFCSTSAGTLLPFKRYTQPVTLPSIKQPSLHFANGVRKAGREWSVVVPITLNPESCPVNAENGGHR